MDLHSANDKTSVDFSRLEGQVERLLLVCEQLRTENRALREKQVAMMAERARLIEKNSAARKQVEAIIARLKAQESDA